MAPTKEPDALDRAPSKPDISEVAATGEEPNDLLDSGPLAEVVRDLPPSIRRRVEMSIMQMGSGGAGLHPLFEKFNETHIDKFMEYSHQDETREHAFRSSSRYFTAFYTVVALGFLAFVLIYFSDDRDVLIQILTILVVFAGGFGSGYGVKTFRGK